MPNKMSGYARAIILLALPVFLWRLDAVFAQQRLARPAIDELFKKAGLSKVNQGNLAADFALRDVNGNSLSLTGSRGNLTFVNFWATWCGPCREEMPSMERLYREMSERGLAMLAISKRENGAQVANFMRSLRLSFPALLDLDGRVSSAYQVYGLPTTFLIDGGGRIIAKRSGAKDWASREAMNLFDALLGGGGRSQTGVASFEGLSNAAAPLATALIVKSPAVALHGQPDAESQLIMRLDRGDQLAPVAKASSGAESWYMVKTRAGAVGWIRATEVDEVANKK